jgi:hypothetical protein
LEFEYACGQLQFTAVLIAIAAKFITAVKTASNTADINKF